MKRNRLFAAAAAVLLLLSVLSGCGQRTSAPGDPIVLTMWHVYGEQADSPMNRLVDEFNATAGKEHGILVNVTRITNGQEVGGLLRDAQQSVAGAGEMPDLFFCHTGNAAALGAGTLIDWNDWFPEAERNSFVESFLEEGTVGDRLTVLPVSKSTHLLFLNGTQFERFSRDTGIRAEDLETWEGFFRAAEQYESWSGGTPFCAMDFLMRAVELHALSGGHALRMENGWYDFQDPALRESWMEFARALVRGQIVVSDLYSNTQVMTGEVAAGLGSSAAILYYNDTVTYADEVSEPMRLQVLPMPRRENGEAVTTQAGVGLCALRSDPEKEKAASVFAHWLTEGKRNLDFVADTGYMPVRSSAYEAIDGYDFSDERYETVYQTLKTVRESYSAYTEPAAPGYYERVGALYSGLRDRQSLWTERCRSGESAEALAEEVWAFLRSV